MKIKGSLCIVLLLLATVSAFNSNNNTTFQKSQDIRGSWKVVQFYGHKKNVLLDSLHLIITLEEGGISNGFMGCNKFRANCNIDNDSISFGTIISTRKFCSKEYMDIEDQFMYVLNNVKTYTIQKNGLILFAGKKKLVQLIKE